MDAYKSITKVSKAYMVSALPGKEGGQDWTEFHHKVTLDLL